MEGTKRTKVQNLYIYIFSVFIFWCPDLIFSLPSYSYVLYVCVCVRVFVFVRNLISVSLKRNNKLNKNKFMAYKKQKSLSCFLPVSLTLSQFCLCSSRVRSSPLVKMSSALLFASPLPYHPSILGLPYSRALPRKFLELQQEENQTKRERERVKK